MFVQSVLGLYKKTCSGDTQNKKNKYLRRKFFCIDPFFLFWRHLTASKVSGEKIFCYRPTLFIRLSAKDAFHRLSIAAFTASRQKRQCPMSKLPVTVLFLSMHSYAFVACHLFHVFYIIYVVHNYFSYHIAVFICNYIVVISVIFP